MKEQVSMDLTAMQDVLAKMRERFRDVRKLLDDHEKFRTDSEPYKMKYQAIENLKTMETDLVDISANVPEEERGEEVIMLAVVHLNLGLLHADTEELKASEEQFMKCIELLKGKELEPEAVLPVLHALNQLGIIWSQWNQPTKAETFLDRAEQIYDDFISTREDPVNVLQNFGIEDTKNELSPKETLEKVHTLTLYYLAQVYRFLQDHHKFAIYCHMTLCGQLGRNDIMRDLDYIDWALNAATLSQYFMENDGFSQARHHLAAASCILQKYEGILKEKTKNNEENEENEALMAEWESFKHRSADVARCWAKYGILLMSLSKERLLEDETEQENNQAESKHSSKSKVPNDLKFTVLEKEIEPIANQITDKYLLDFSDAKLVFLNTQKWLEQAKAYYTLENHASDHVLIVQDISQAYKYLLFFEEDRDRQAKMHKRRINALEDVIKELNPQYYKSACRQIWFELGEIYSEILDLKLDRLNSSKEKLTPQALMKINQLARNSIKNFQLFLSSIESRPTDSGIQEFPDELMQPALFCYFYIGRLYKKLITPDEVTKSENAQNSINAFKFIIDYCDKYPKAAEMMRVELNHCREFVNLLQILHS